MTQRQLMQEIGNSTTKTISKLKVGKLKDQILKLTFLQQIDICSLPIKLNISHNLKTKLGGIIHIVIIVFCLWLTYLTFFIDTGITLTSKILLNEVMTEGNTKDDVKSLFSYHPEPIGISMINTYYLQDRPYFNRDLFTVLGFVNENGIIRQLNISKKCESSDFCIKSSQNQDLAFYIKQTDGQIVQSYVYFHIFQYLGTSGSLASPNPAPFNQKLSYDIQTVGFVKQTGKISVVKKRNKIPYQQYRIPSPSVPIYTPTIMVSSEKYTTNTKFMGHLGNLFPSQYQFYTFSDETENILINNQNPIFPRINATISYSIVSIMPSAKLILSRQEFQDLSTVLVFYLSIKQTLYYLAIFFFIQRYDQNSAYLSIANTFYYLEDHRRYQKFSFQNNFPSYLACILYRSMLLNIIKYVSQKRGKNLSQVLPRKCYYAMLLMKKAQQMLSQDNFFNNLQKLSFFQDLTFKKIILKPSQVVEEQQEQIQLDYFPNNPSKRYSFLQLCELNGWKSPERKNHIYRIITSKTFQLPLCLELQHQFNRIHNLVKKRVHCGLLTIQGQSEQQQIHAALQDQDQEKQQSKEEEIKLNLNAFNILVPFNEANNQYKIEESQAWGDKKIEKAEYENKKQIINQFNSKSSKMIEQKIITQKDNHKNDCKKDDKSASKIEDEDFFIKINAIP